MENLKWKSFGYGMESQDKLNWAIHNLKYIKQQIENLDPGEVSKLFEQFKKEVQTMFINFETETDQKLLDQKVEIEKQISDLEIELAVFTEEVRTQLETLQEEIDKKQDNFTATNGLVYDPITKILGVLVDPKSIGNISVSEKGLLIIGLGGSPLDQYITPKNNQIVYLSTPTLVDDLALVTKQYVDSSFVKDSVWIFDNVIGRISVNEVVFPNYKYLDITDSNDLPTNILGVAIATELTHAMNLGQTQTLISKSNWWMANNGELLVNVSNFTTAPYSSINIGGVAFAPIHLRGIAEGTDPSGAVPYSQLLKLLPDNIFKKTGSGQIIWDDSIIQFVSTLDLQGKNNTAIPVVGVANATQADGAVNLAQLQAKTERAINLQGKNTDQWNLDFNFISGKKYRVYYNFMAVSKEASMQEKVLIWKNTPIIIDTYFEQQNAEQAIFQVRCYSNNVQMLKMTTAGKLTRGWILGVQEIL